MIAVSLEMSDEPILFLFYAFDIFVWLYLSVGMIRCIASHTDVKY